MQNFSHLCVCATPNKAAKGRLNLRVARCEAACATESEIEITTKELHRFKCYYFVYIFFFGCFNLGPSFYKVSTQVTREIVLFFACVLKAKHCTVPITNSPLSINKKKKQNFREFVMEIWLLLNPF